jgi:hypothetical protein
MRKISDRKNESGVAIILALIFLVIFMILAFAFTAKSIAAGRSGLTQSNEIHAQALCESVLQEAIGKLRSSYDSGQFSPCPDADSTSWVAVSYTLPSTTYTTKILPFIATEAADTQPTQNDIAIDFFGSTNCAPSMATLDWGALSSPASTGEPQKIKTIYSWYILPLTGRLDPNEVVTTTTTRTGFSETTDDLSTYKKEIDVSGITARPISGSYWKSIQHIGATYAEDTSWKAYLPHGTYTNLPAKNVASTININTATTDEIYNKMTNNGTTSAADLAAASQIACNIVDMRDADSISTTKTVGTETYYGVEKTHGINEIRLKFTNNSTANAAGGPISLNIDAAVELLNPFTSPQTLDYTLSMSGTVTITGVGAANFTIPTLNYSAASAAFVQQAANVTITNADTNNPSTLQITRIVINNLILNTPAGPVDFMKSYDSAATITQSFGIGVSTWFSMSAKDVRANHNPASDWDVNTTLLNQVGAPTSVTLGAANKTSAGVSLLKYKTSENVDNEPGSTELTDVSTVVKFPANTAITSLSQLGFVSRAEPFKTLNMCDYNQLTPNAFSLTAYQNTATTPIYTTPPTFSTASNGGDRQLLDKFTLGAAASSDPDTNALSMPGCINPNSTINPALQALFTGVTADTVAIPAATITALTAKFPGIIGGTTYANQFFSIEDLNPLTRNPPGYGKAFSAKLFPDTVITDRQREELLWKTKNLISSECYFMVVGSVITGYDLSTSANSQRSSLVKMTAIVKRAWNTSTNKFDFSVISRDYKVE